MNGDRKELSNRNNNNNNRDCNSNNNRITVDYQSVNRLTSKFF